MLSKRSPFSLKLTFEQLKRGAAYRTLKEALIVEYRLVTRVIRHPDFVEGVRAIIIEKDHQPKWREKYAAEVSDAFVASFFDPLPEGDLALVDYWMPAAGPS